MRIMSIAVSASPLLGLLSTVWGVLESSMQMAWKVVANLSAVGSGIRTATLTTVVGLLLPVPSSLVYTMLIPGIPQGDSPLLLNTSYTITADVEIPESGAEGMLLTSGGRFGGYGFYFLKGKPVFLWNLVDLKRIRWVAPEVLPPGKHTIEFDFKYDGLGAGTLAFNSLSGIGQSGTGVLKVDGKEVASQKMEHTVPLILQWDETFDTGADTGTPVDDKDYQCPFKFTGKLNKLTLKLDRPKLSPEDIKKLEGAERNNKASE